MRSWGWTSVDEGGANSLVRLVLVKGFGRVCVGVPSQGGQAPACSHDDGKLRVECMPMRNLSKVWVEVRHETMLVRRWSSPDRWF
jgi:hypothetical protein